MESLSGDLISVLQYLIPGFLAAWVFYGLTSYRKPSQFERIVQALIFTIIIQATVFLEQQIYSKISEQSVLEWSDQALLVCSTVTAIIVGTLFSYLTNNDVIHRLARSLSITRETSYTSQWFRAFFYRVTYVVLHLKDDRRIFGWPAEWPSQPDVGHFVLEQPSWLDEEKEVKLDGVSAILVNVEDVRWVEFMQPEAKSEGHALTSGEQT